MCFRKIALAAGWRMDKWRHEDKEVVTMIPETVLGWGGGPGASAFSKPGSLLCFLEADAVGIHLCPLGLPLRLCSFCVL